MKSVVFSLLLSGLVFSQNVEQIGGFGYIDNKDPITDEDISAIIATETNGPNYREGALIFACGGELLNVMLVADEFLTTEEETKVTWRFDKLEPTERTWYLSSNGTGAFAQEGDISELVNAALTSSSAVFRIADYEGSTYTYTFDLKGFTEAITRLKCASKYLP